MNEEYQITVTIKDNLTGETEIVSVGDDYLLICAGKAEMANVQVYPGKGTHVITVKNAGQGRKKVGQP